MRLDEYFKNKPGVGILSTANSDGEVDAAIFARPRILEDNTLAFIMRARLTHKNLQSNPHAVYLFMEEGRSYKGIRLFLKKIREDSDPKLLAAMTRRHLPPDEDKARGRKYIVYFEITKKLPLIGSGTAPLTP